MEKILRKKLSKLAATIAHPYTFFIAVCISVIWIFWGLLIHYPEYWVKGTEFTTAFVTFLVVFIVQFSEESELEALQQKLDSVINALPGADNQKMQLEKEIKAEEKE